MTPAIRGSTGVFALLGHPVDHSLSPMLHNAWLTAAGIDAVYVALPAPRLLADLPATLRELGIRGANLTLPHKVAVVPKLDRVDAVVAACGACNTLTITDGVSHGFNTDGPGLLAALRELGIALAGARAAVLGTGGAARAAVWALGTAGAAPPTVLGRRERVAAEIAHPYGGAGRPLTPAAFAEIAPTLDLVIHALPAVARPSVLALPTRALPGSCAWIDLNYFDPDPPHLTSLAARGHPVQRGDRMLLHQGALAFQRFTGCTPALDLGHAVLESAARRRHG